jgi:quinol-cytochrome oxidoreductase complex cytochrome b subunit
VGRAVRAQIDLHQERGAIRRYPRRMNINPFYPFGVIALSPWSYSAENSFFD